MFFKNICYSSFNFHIYYVHFMLCFIFTFLSRLLYTVHKICIQVWILFESLLNTTWKNVKVPIVCIKLVGVLVYENNIKQALSPSLLCLDSTGQVSLKGTSRNSIISNNTDQIKHHIGAEKASAVSWNGKKQTTTPSPMKAIIDNN